VKEEVIKEVPYEVIKEKIIVQKEIVDREIPVYIEKNVDRIIEKPVI
jgi:hypothetical protein